MKKGQEYKYNEFERLHFNQIKLIAEHKFVQKE